MAGRGRVPKRDAERRRRNKPVIPTEAVAMSGTVRQPAVDRDWHPKAKRWYRSLKSSGQAQFYEPSDWMTAKWVAELESVVYRDIDSGARPSSDMVKAITPLMTSLLTTEGERRRIRIEIERGSAPAEVTAMDAYRRARTG